MANKIFLALFLALVSMQILASPEQNNGLPTSFVVGKTPFSDNLSLSGIGFNVSSPNVARENRVTITPIGFKRNLEAIQIPVNGLVTGAEVADLNNDGYPEVYIYINTADQYAYGSLVAYASNKNLSVTPIYFPPLSEADKKANAYKGHDEFAVVENRLMRRYPTAKSNGIQHYHQIQYQLAAGEAGWVLKPSRAINF